LPCRHHKNTPRKFICSRLFLLLFKGRRNC
jgi:hypothetical protein